MEKFKRINREKVYDGAILEFCKDEIITPEGKKVYWDFLQHKGAAAVIPVMSDGRIIMVRQWRNAIDKYTLEIPAGGKDSIDEPTLKIEFLQTLAPAVAYSGEKIDVYVAFDLEKTHQHLDPDEYIDLEVYTVEELIEKILSNEINDAKTISSILTYYHKYCTK